ncbi:MAG: hypothetical protein JWP61_2086 [Friedmanniella sp.]|nr:hypothetical protein [Friedmanniella sp.]
MSTRLSCQRVRGERGSATVELALLVPGLVLMLGLTLAGGRVWFARTTVNEAAQSAARAASLARSVGEAVPAGRQAGLQSLATEGLECRATAVSVDAAAFAVPVGQPATVRSAVTCDLSFADLLLPGAPGAIRLVGRGASALDTYRAR